MYVSLFFHYIYTHTTYFPCPWKEWGGYINLRLAVRFLDPNTDMFKPRHTGWFGSTLGSVNWLNEKEMLAGNN
jgi:hypothetical protein